MKGVVVSVVLVRGHLVWGKSSEKVSLSMLLSFLDCLLQKNRYERRFYIHVVSESRFPLSCHEAVSQIL